MLPKGDGTRRRYCRRYPREERVRPDPGTVTAASGLPGVDLVLVVDDGSRDGTARAAELAGATVMRHARTRGKAAAMETGAEAIRLLDRQENRNRPRHLLFLDADLGSSAAFAAPLTQPVTTGQADMTIAAFTSTVKLGGHGMVVGLSGAGIRPSARPGAAAQRQRCLTRAAFEAAAPGRRRRGTALTIDLARKGLRITEVEVPLAHRARRERTCVAASPGTNNWPTWRGRWQRGDRGCGRLSCSGRTRPGTPRALRVAGRPVRGDRRQHRVTFTVAVAGLRDGAAASGADGPAHLAFSAHLSPYLAVALAGTALVAGTFAAPPSPCWPCGGLNRPRLARPAGWPHGGSRADAGAALRFLRPAQLRRLPAGCWSRARPLRDRARRPRPPRGSRSARRAGLVHHPVGLRDRRNRVQALASLISGTSARLTVFVLSVLNLLAFGDRPAAAPAAIPTTAVASSRGGLLW